jgi:hypothetical protein
MSVKKPIPVSRDELITALNIYKTKNEDLIANQTDDENVFELLRGDVSLKAAYVEGQLKPNFNDSDFEETIIKIIMENREEGPKASNLPTRRDETNIISNGRSNYSRSQGALEAVRDCQATEKATYSTGKGKKAASAKTNIAALMEAGGSLEIVKRTHTLDFIEVIGRATLKGQYTEGSRSFYKQEYLAKKAWEWIIKVLIKEPEIVTGTDEYGMPEFKEGSIIKVRVNDDDNSFLVPLPAKVALWREMAREWQAAGRVAETVAYSRAADMILRQDFQSKEELAEEKAEVQAIKESAKAEVA